MKVLVIHIYNETENYKKMLDIQQKYIREIKNIINSELLDIECFFVTYGVNQEDVIVENDMIYIRSDENYKENLMGIVNKTIKSLEYLIDFKKNTYDFVIRTNISTIINYSSLLDFLNKIPNNEIYTGGKLECLKWIDLQSGINEKSTIENNLNGLFYIQGIGIIWSFDIAKFIIKNKNKVNYSIVDDVTLGLFIRDNLPNVYNKILSQKYAKYSLNCNKDAIFLRIKTPNRRNDIKKMEEYIQEILKTDN